METVSGKSLSKIGIGSFGVGGRGHRDVEITEKQPEEVYIDSLVYTLQKGSNFTEIALGYGHGQTLVLFKKALNKSGISRQDIFLTHSLYTRDILDLGVLNQDIANFYEVMDTDYTDSTLVTQSLLLKFGHKSIYDILHDLLNSGKTRYVSLSNASPASIRAFKQEFGDKFFAHEGHLSFEVRALQNEGVFQTCKELGVENIIWRPLGRKQTLERNWDLLNELAAKYNKTQSQIILNWICSLGYRPMVFSTNLDHINENLASTNFQMSEDDYKRMTEFRPLNYQPSVVDWEGPNTDEDIVLLIRNFDNHLQPGNNS